MLDILIALFLIIVFSILSNCFKPKETGVNLAIRRAELIDILKNRNYTQEEIGYITRNNKELCKLMKKY